MRVHGKHYRTIWADPDDPAAVKIINQQLLPHAFEIMTLRSVDDAAEAIRDMYVRGAGLIGAAAAWGMYLASLSTGEKSLGDIMIHLQEAGEQLKSTRPTAKNLEWAVHRILSMVENLGPEENLTGQIFREAQAITDEDAEFCQSIGRYGISIISDLYNKKKRRINILTHCNAGWLAFVDYGSATAPVYAAHDAGIPVHVYVDETRPRNQGAALTAWELQQHGVPSTLIVDNAGGHLMQHGMIDMVIVGTDRTTRGGDVANKIGTYLKALAAVDNGVPFYVALPSSSIDWDITDGKNQIPIEKRNGDEVRLVQGKREDEVCQVMICPEGMPVSNYGFDVTPGRLISGLITERGICPASEEGLVSLFPEHR